MNWLRRLLRKPAVNPELKSELKSVAATPPAAFSPSPAAPKPVSAPLAADPPEVWVAAIAQAPDKATGLAWLQTLADEESLLAVAIQAGFADVRFAAAQRLTQSALLEKAAQASREKDKRVHRHCSQVLKQRQEAEQGARRAASLQAELQALLAQAPVSTMRLIELEKAVNALDAQAAGAQECAVLIEAAHRRAQDEAVARRDLQRRLTQATALAAEAGVDADQWQAYSERYATLAAEHAALPGWLAELPAAQQTATLLATVAERVQMHADELESIRQCEAFLAQSEANGGEATPDEAAWDALPKPRQDAAMRALQQRWHALRRPPASPAIETAAVEVAPEPVRDLPSLDEKPLKSQLNALEDRLTQGHLAEAEALAKEIATLLAGRRLHGAAEARWQRLNVQLGELRSWARWGSGQAREKLIVDAEALAAAQAPVKELLTRVPALREEWKRLNAHGAATKEQWLRFDGLLEQAYAPAAAYLAAEAARHAEVETAKNALCQEWETALAAIVWESADYAADYAALEAQRQAMLQRWRDLGKAAPRQERQLRKRFDTTLAAVDARLDAVRAAELQRRRQLIFDAEALAHAPDLGRAIAAAKELQDRWNQVGPLRLARGDDQITWRHFRAACDALFTRRNEQRAAHAAQREQLQQERLALLDALQQAADSSDVNVLKQALTQFEAAWANGKNHGRDTKEKDDALELRARELRQRVQQRIDDLRLEKARLRFTVLAQKSALAQRIEQAALDGLADGSSLTELQAAVQAEWRALPRLAAAIEQRMVDRLQRAAQMAADAWTQGAAQRESLLLDLELALQLPSPGVDAEARRQRQLQRLQKRFGAEAAGMTEIETQLGEWHAIPAPSTPAHEPRIEAIVAALIGRSTPPGEKNARMR